MNLICLSLTCNLYHHCIRTRESRQELRKFMRNIKKSNPERGSISYLFKLLHFLWYFFYKKKNKPERRSFYLHLISCLYPFICLYNFWQFSTTKVTYFILFFHMRVKQNSNHLKARCFLEYDRLYVDHKCYIWNDVLGQVKKTNFCLS